MIDLLREFKELVLALNGHGVPYAVCGGLALAVHGYSRATIDIDLLVPSQSVRDVLNVAESLGFGLETELEALGGGRISLTRVTKTALDSEDHLILDVLHVTTVFEDIWDRRQLVTAQFGPVWVLSKEALIAMKSLRNSKQDAADIEFLREVHDGS